MAPIHKNGELKGMMLKDWEMLLATWDLHLHTLGFSKDGMMMMVS